MKKFLKGLNEYHVAVMIVIAIIGGGATIGYVGYTLGYEIGYTSGESSTLVKLQGGQSQGNTGAFPADKLFSYNSQIINTYN